MRERLPALASERPHVLVPPSLSMTAAWTCVSELSFLIGRTQVIIGLSCKTLQNEWLYIMHGFI